MQVTVNHRVANGDLDPEVGVHVREHVDAGTVSLARGVAVPVYELEVLRRLNDRHGAVMTPAQELAAAERLFQRSQVRVGVEALRHRGDPEAPELLAARARRSAARRRVRAAAQAQPTGDASNNGAPADSFHNEPAGPEVAQRCPSCGQFNEPGHVCAVPEGLPAADYADLRGPERTKEMLADLQTAVSAVVESGQLSRWLDAMASNGLNRWSMNNRLLAVMQLAQRGESLEKVHLMGFRQWQEKFGRHVGKGERAVWILAPVTRKVRDEDDTGSVSEKVMVTGFKPVPVFNVTQTTGQPLPESPLRPPAGEATIGTLDGLRARVGAAGYSYEEKEIPGCNPRTGEGTLGYTNPSTKQIVVDARLNGAQKASTIAHELGHVHCGHVDGNLDEYRQHRGRMETEAEMTAYMVNRSRGMDRSEADAFSPSYIASWSKGDPVVMTAAMDRATRAFNKILDGSWPETQG